MYSSGDVPKVLLEKLTPVCLIISLEGINFETHEKDIIDNFAAMNLVTWLQTVSLLPQFGLRIPIFFDLQPRPKSWLVDSLAAVKNCFTRNQMVSLLPQFGMTCSIIDHLKA
jgi:hypothetical protein